MSLMCNFGVRSRFLDVIYGLARLTEALISYIANGSNSVIYWLINHCKDWRDPHSVASFIFLMSSITYSLVTLTIDGLMLFVQLMDIQNICINMRFSPNKSYRKF